MRMTTGEAGVSLNLSPIAPRSSSTSGSGESQNSSDVSGNTEPASSALPVQPAGAVAVANQASPQGPIASAIQNSLGFGNTSQMSSPPDYSNYYSAFYQAHTDPNAPIPHSNYFPNHHFTVSSLIQKPGATVPYPKL